MSTADLSLKWLAVFRSLARSGAVQVTAEEMGLSVSTVSSHLTRLETALGTDLLDHRRRPMALTPEGALFLRYVDTALEALDKGKAELAARGLHNLQSLHFAMIEDFDAEIGPEITRILARALPECRLTHHSRASHDILDALSRRKLDLGIATLPPFAPEGLIDLPLLRDPFVLAVPASHAVEAEALIAGDTALPFLRYSQDQIIGTMIAAHLRRLRLDPKGAFELDSTHSILALVAQGSGWAITTPTCYAHARRFQPQVRLLPFPRSEFARTISIFLTEGPAEPVASLIDGAMRNLLAARVIAPVVESFPWLKPRFRLVARDEG